MPNTLAYAMLLVWPVVCIVLFRKMALERAIIWSILGGYLLLPPRAVFDFPLVPDFNKTSIPSLCALAFCLLLARRRLPVWPRNRAMLGLMLLFVLGAIPTVLTNTDPILFTSITNTEPVSFESGRLPGLRLIDTFSAMSEQMIVLIPFVLGRAFLSSATGLRELLLALVVGGLAYSLPTLVEWRLSPQINIWVYGFFQHEFGQMMRDGGFRPLVFLPHALWLSFFMMTAAVSAAVLSRDHEGTERARLLVAMLYLCGVIVLCKSLASLLYAIAFIPLLLLTGPRLQVRAAVILAAIAVIYPILRDYDVVPLAKLLEWAEAIDPDRRQSLEYRFDNEEMLLAHAHEKWLFGWGGWGRNLVHDLQSGDLLTIPDGEWIIAFGTYGWVGYIALMGLLSGPLILLWRGMRRQVPSRHAAALAIILAATMVDMLINAILTPYTWLIAGAILGYCENVKVQERRREIRAGAARAPLL